MTSFELKETVERSKPFLRRLSPLSTPRFQGGDDEGILQRKALT
jgi:hypothetical protein